ncbi:alpha/beta fold hydrolase [Sanguibacter suaedae]|uniref:alpha/beta fold hydrolase n=1 Tax=Sanguibacter suaedae TaxID=2795737 RepID=UPI0027DE1B96|nr:alpha/beta hydrolase [Sanguibacter suaedae]
MVLVHGVRTSRTMWRAQEEVLRAAGHRVVAVDLPGHGRRLDEPFTVDRCLEVVDEAVESLGGTAALVGLSLGGYVSVAYAARRPDRVAVLVAAGCCTSPTTPLRGVWGRLARWIESWEDSGERLNAELVRRTLDVQAAHDVAAGGFALTVVSGMLEEIGTVDPIALLPRVRCPIHLVNGRFDHFRTQERAFVRAARASGRPVRLVVVPGAKHLVALDAPVTFSRVVLEALEDVQVPGAEASPPERRLS